MGSRDPGTLYLCHGASQRRDQQHSPEKPADHYSPDRRPPVDPLSHHVVAASFDQDDHVLMNHSPCAVVSTATGGRTFLNQDDSQSGIWLTVEGKWEYRFAHRFKLK